MNDIEVFRSNIIHSDDPDANEINEEYHLSLDDLTSFGHHATKCGQLLIIKKSTMAHGDWEAWIKSNCDFSIDTAQRYMRAATKTASMQFIRNNNCIDANSSEIDAIRIAVPKSKQSNKTKKEVPFDWATNALVRAAAAGIVALRRCIAILRGTDRDRGGAEYYLHMFKEALTKILQSLEDY